MYVKFLSKNLNPSSYPLHPTSTYNYGMTIILKVRGDHNTWSLFNCFIGFISGNLKALTNA